MRPLFLALQRLCLLLVYVLLTACDDSPSSNDSDIFEVDESSIEDWIQLYEAGNAFAGFNLVQMYLKGSLESHPDFNVEGVLKNISGEIDRAKPLLMLHYVKEKQASQASEILQSLMSSQRFFYHQRFSGTPWDESDPDWSDQLSVYSSSEHQHSRFNQLSETFKKAPPSFFSVPVDLDQKAIFGFYDGDGIYHPDKNKRQSFSLLSSTDLLRLASKGDEKANCLWFVRELKEDGLALISESTPPYNLNGNKISGRIEKGIESCANEGWLSFININARLNFYKDSESSVAAWKEAAIQGSPDALSHLVGFIRLGLVEHELTREDIEGLVDGISNLRNDDNSIRHRFASLNLTDWLDFNAKDLAIKELHAISEANWNGAGRAAMSLIAGFWSEPNDERFGPVYKDFDLDAWISNGVQNGARYSASAACSYYGILFLDEEDEKLAESYLDLSTDQCLIAAYDGELAAQNLLASNYSLKGNEDEALLWKLVRNELVFLEDQNQRFYESTINLFTQRLKPTEAEKIINRAKEIAELIAAK